MPSEIGRRMQRPQSEEFLFTRTRTDTTEAEEALSSLTHTSHAHHIHHHHTTAVCGGREEQGWEGMEGGAGGLKHNVNGFLPPPFPLISHSFSLRAPPHRDSARSGDSFSVSVAAVPASEREFDVGSGRIVAQGMLEVYVLEACYLPTAEFTRAFAVVQVVHVTLTLTLTGPGPGPRARRDWHTSLRILCKDSELTPLIHIIIVTRITHPGTSPSVAPPHSESSARISGPPLAPQASIRIIITIITQSGVPRRVVAAPHPK
jgi:hypothetical protein